MRITFEIAARFRPERAPHLAEHLYLVRSVEWDTVPRKGDHIDLGVGAPANLVEVKEATFHLDGTAVVRANWMPLDIADIDAMVAAGWQQVDR